MKYNVSYVLTADGTIAVEAANETEAREKFNKHSTTELLNIGRVTNTLTIEAAPLAEQQSALAPGPDQTKRYH